MRDDFSEEVKRTLANRVSNDCSNPECYAPTSGPQLDSAKALNIGVAAHITSASPGGPRYNPSLTSEQRCHADNGIWLCQNCAKLIDNDVARFSEKLLRAWKTVAEDRALNAIGKTATETETRLAPKLELYLEYLGVTRDTWSPREPSRHFVLGLKNGAVSGTAKYPCLRYRRACGLIVSRHGIDGCFGFGLPRSPSENEWETFRGGANQVIHAGETLKITELSQSGHNLDAAAARYPLPVIRAVKCQWSFDSVTFQCEISAEGIAAVAIERTIPGHSVEWSM